MSYDFFNRKMLVGRKHHTCEHCRTAIPLGETHYYCSGKFEGYMMSYREHLVCEKAWSELNHKLRDNRWDDTHPFLADDDFDKDEQAWLHRRFPIVAKRLWPKLFGDAA